MFQVIQTYSEDEPWWFFDEWQDNIKAEMTFTKFHDAEKEFMKQYDALHTEYQEVKCKDPYLVAFWNDEEYIYCEDCDEDLQAYRGLMLVKDYKKIDLGDNDSDETAGNSRKTKCCQRFSQSARSNQKK